MAKKSRESFQKRAREKARQEKQAEKREKRQAASEDEENLSRAEEDSLMQEFAQLSARYDNDQISIERYEEERHRIFVELGLDPDE